MKIDAEIRITKSPNEEILPTGTTLTVAIDGDYVTDGDEIITSVESKLYDTYGASFWNAENFDILNYNDLCEDLFNVD